MEDIAKIVAQNVRAARAKADLSQEDLAYQAGVDRSYLWGIEGGTRNPTIQVIAKLADALGVTSADLMTKRGR